MKKFWFLMVILALISFTSCKKENMIIGEWELISIEGDTNLAKTQSAFYVYEFYEGGYYVIKAGGWDIIFLCEYSISNSKIDIKPFGYYTPFISMKISFSDSKNMVWKGKENKVKYTFKKKS